MQKLRENSYNLDIEVITTSPKGVAEVCAKGVLALGLWLVYLTEPVHVGLGKDQVSPANMQLHTSLQFQVQN
jgi:hypothetical protein